MRTFTQALTISLPSVISAFQGTAHLSASRSLFDTNVATAAAVCYHGRRGNGVPCRSGKASPSRVFRPRPHRLGAAQQPSGESSSGSGLEEITVEIKGGIKVRVGAVDMMPSATNKRIFTFAELLLPPTDGAVEISIY